MEEFKSRCLIQIRLPAEPATCDRSYCLRQISPTKFATCYYNEEQDSFYYSHYFTNLSDAYEEFNREMTYNMNHYSAMIDSYYKHRHIIM